MQLRRFNSLRILLALLSFAVIGLVAWLVLFPGKEERLLSLLEKHARSTQTHDQAEREAAETAIRRFGTNALPILTEWVGKKDSASSKKLRSALKPLPFLFQSLSANDYHAAAHYGFGVINSVAKPAVPSLIDLLTNPDPSVKDSAVLCLGAIGPAAEEAVPALLPLTKDQPDNLNPNDAVVALGLIRAKSERVVPLLIGYLDGSSAKSGQQEWSIRALAEFGSDAKAAVPRLLRLLDNPSLNSAVSDALKRIDPEAAAAAGIK